MKKSILENKMILAVDNEPSVLAVLEKEIRTASPDCIFDKATTYREARERMIGLTYDAVIIDIMDERSRELAELADHRNLLLVLLTAHPSAHESLRDYACLPKGWLSKVVPFLEEVLKSHDLPVWRRLVNKIIGSQGKKIEIDWRKELELSPQG